MEDVIATEMQRKPKYICPFLPEMNKTLSRFDNKVAKKLQVVSDLKNKRKSQGYSINKTVPSPPKLWRHKTPARCERLSRNNLPQSAMPKDRIELDNFLGID